MSFFCPYTTCPILQNERLQRPFAILRTDDIEKPKTNEDRIRSMTVEELAELLFHRGNGQEYCYGICVRQDECEIGPDDRRICIDNIVKWLKSPYDREVSE